jgi:hypothetical protein
MPSLEVSHLNRKDLDRAITQSLFENDLLLWGCYTNCEGFVELIKDGQRLAIEEAISEETEHLISKEEDATSLLSKEEHHATTNQDLVRASNQHLAETDTQTDNCMSRSTTGYHHALAVIDHSKVKIANGRSRENSEGFLDITF